MNWKVFLRPVGLPVLVVSLFFLPFFPVVTVAGLLFYGGTVYWAVQRQKNRALPPGVEDEIGRLPYRRRKMANLAVAAARDVERLLTTLPRDVTSRIPFSASEAGGIAAAVVFYLRQQAEADKLAAAGNAEAKALASRAGEMADKSYAQLQTLQQALAGLSLTAGGGEREALALQARTAAEEVLALKRAVEEAATDVKALTGGDRP